MPGKSNNLLLSGLLAMSLGALCPSRALAATSPYPRMAPLAKYLMARDAEVALARSAAPPAISTDAEVLVMGRGGYTAVAKGKNEFVCLVERSWAAPSSLPEFWNPKVRSPICFNAAGARTVLPSYLLKTKLVLAGKSKMEVVQALAAAFDSKALPALAPAAMCYMQSKQQYVNDGGRNWHPHLMFFVQGDAAKSWGANLPGSPVIALNDADERMTIFMVWAGKWSDGTLGPDPMH